MVKNFLTLMYRHLSKSLLSSFIGFFGMIFGLTTFLFILLWVTNELKFDEFNVDKEQIYRLEFDDKSGNYRAYLPSIVATLLKDNVPEVKNSTRLRVTHNTRYIKSLDPKSQNFIDAGKITYASNDFFKIFSFKFIVGDSDNSLLKNRDVVITESLAKTVFDRTDIVGETLMSPIGKEYNITGVIKDEPNFHIPFKMIMSFKSLEKDFKSLGLESLDTWYFDYMPTYLKVSNNYNTRDLEEKIESVINQSIPEKAKQRQGEFNCYLRPLGDIYFKGAEAKEEGYAIHGNLKKITAYISIAILMLILVCINFINLNTSNYLNRIKEIGIKKISGATKKLLIIQFFGETLIVILLSFIVALAIVYRFLPSFNYLMYSNLEISSLLNTINIISIFIGLLLMSFFSGGIPSLYITAFNPIQILKGIKSQGKKFSFTKTNLIIQFVMTTILLIITLTVYSQINFMRNSDLGFEKEHKIHFPINATKSKMVERVKTGLLSNPNIINFSTSFYGTPGVTSNSTDRKKEKVEYNGRDYEINWIWADENYAETLDLKLIEGKFFDKNPGYNIIYESGETSTTFLNKKSDRIKEIIRDVVLNETAVKMMNLETPLESFIKIGGNKCKVIGVIKDFHLSSLDNQITPLYFIKRGGYDAILKISSQNVPQTIEFIKQKVKELSGKNLQNIKFLDEEFDKLYRKDKSFSKLLGFITLFAILIACMGLLGMVSQTIMLRIKEVGVRKSLGSTSSEILILFIKPIIQLIIISTLIAIPVSWYFANDWLSNYPYHTGINWWIFLFAFVFMLVTTLLTVVWKCSRAASRNPIELLRDE